MWQDILAADSRISHLRFNPENKLGKMTSEKDVRPMYIKRRHQILQGNFQQQESETEDHLVGPIRNKRYLSLRVKLLKRQFSLPSDVLSLGSLSLQQQKQNHAQHVPSASTGINFLHDPKKSRLNFNGVHHIYDHHKKEITRVQFLHGRTVDDNVRFVCSSMDGRVSLCDLQSKSYEMLSLTNESGVVDLDLSESNELLVFSHVDGELAIWNLQQKSQTRRVRGLEMGAYVKFCRFLPQNNNLVVCGIVNHAVSMVNNNNNNSGNGTVRILNISTGMFVTEGSPMIGKPTAVALNAKGTLLWVGYDKGQVESFRLDCESFTSVQKGSRFSISHHAISSISARNDLGKISCKPCLVVTTSQSSSMHILALADEVFGRSEPLLVLDSGGSRQSLTKAVFAPILSHSNGVMAVSGAADGSISFFDLEKSVATSSTTSPSSSSSAGNCCVNTLYGHAHPVIELSFSRDESFIASGDSLGQIIVWKK